MPKMKMIATITIPLFIRMQMKYDEIDNNCNELIDDDDSEIGGNYYYIDQDLDLLWCILPSSSFTYLRL